MARLRRVAPGGPTLGDLERFDPEQWRDDAADRRHRLSAEFGFPFVRNVLSHARWSAARQAALPPRLRR